LRGRALALLSAIEEFEEIRRAAPRQSGRSRRGSQLLCRMPRGRVRQAPRAADQMTLHSPCRPNSPAPARTWAGFLPPPRK